MCVCVCVCVCYRRAGTTYTKEHIRQEKLIKNITCEKKQNSTILTKPKNFFSIIMCNIHFLIIYTKNETNHTCTYYSTISGKITWRLNRGHQCCDGCQRHYFKSDEHSYLRHMYTQLCTLTFISYLNSFTTIFMKCTTFNKIHFLFDCRSCSNFKAFGYL